MSKRYLLQCTNKTLKGTVHVPSSKSISNRLLIIRELAGRSFTIQNLSDSDDTGVLVYGLNTMQGTVDIGHAGTSMRFLTAFLATKEGLHILTGSERMKNRPIGKLVDALVQMGGYVEYIERDGYPPLLIKGKKMRGGEISIDSSVSSQFISALLMIGPTLSNGLTLHLENKVISASYIQMTLNLMKDYGISSEIIDNTIYISHQSYTSKVTTVETDWSGASYWFAFTALAKEAQISIPNLLENSIQGDSRVVEIFHQLGVQSQFKNNALFLTKHDAITPLLEYNFIECPDIVQTTAVACVLKKVPFRFTGTQSLRIKETDRITALQNELRKFGARLDYDGAGTLCWDGTFLAAPIHPVSIATYDDHRMAMAFACVPLIFDKVQIQEPNVVSKSYPTFWECIKSIGIDITQE